MNKIKTYIFFIIISFFLFNMYAYGNTDLIMDVNIGFDGKCKLDGLNPVSITILSKNRDIDGDLILKLDDRLYKSSINLPKGTKKIIDFSIPILKGNTNVEICFTSEEDIILSKNIAPEIINSKSIVIGLLSETPEDLYYIKGVRPYFSGNKEVVTINLDENMDYTLDELENINVIVLDNFNTGGLSEEKQDLIFNWINKGGLVLVGIGEFGYKTLSGIFSDINEEKRIGLGAIIGLSNNPIKHKNIHIIQDTIEKNITPKGLDVITNGQGLNKKAQASKEIQFVPDHLFSLKGDKLLFLTILLFIYLILIVGILFWKKRPRGTTFGVIIGVSLLFYILALTNGLEDSKAVSSSIILHNEQTSFSLANVYPFKQDMMSIDVSDLSFIKELTSNKYEIDPINDEIIYYGDSPHYLFIKDMDNREKSKLTLELDQDQISGELINPLSYRLYNAFLIIGDTVVDLGDIKGRERVKMEYKLDHNLFSLSDYNYTAKICEITGLDSYKKVLLEYYLAQIKTKGVNCKIIGFSEKEKKIEIDGKSKKVKNLGLNIYTVNIKSNTGDILLPPQFIEPVSNHNKELSKKVQNEYNLSKDDELLLYYIIPSSIMPSSISVYTKIEGGKMDIKIYNHHKHIWESLKNEMLKENNLKYYTENKPLSLKITGEGRLIIPQISVKGYINPGDELYE